MFEEIPVWTLVLTACISPLIIPIVVLYIEYRSGFFNIRHKKQLSYDLYKALILDKSSDEVGKDLTILYDSIEVESVTSFFITFKNSGNQPITSTDFEEPLSFSFEGSGILKFKVIDPIPTDLAFNGRPIGIPDQNIPDGFMLDPLLLNKGDEFTAYLLVSDYTAGSERISARIVGADLVEGIPETFKLDRNFWWNVFVLLFGVILPIIFIIIMINYLLT